MSLMPAVRASLAERFIFNFRLPMQMLASYLPISWLAPKEVRGYGVASFCILDLRGITVAPLTTQIGLSSISCAPRYAVLDVSHEQASPAVFVTERQPFIEAPQFFEMGAPREHAGGGSHECGNDFCRGLLIAK